MTTTTFGDRHPGGIDHQHRAERLTLELQRKQKEYQNAKRSAQKTLFMLFIMILAFVFQSGIMMNLNDAYDELQSKYDHVTTAYTNLENEYSKLQLHIEQLANSETDNSTDSQLESADSLVYNTNIPMSRDLQEYAYNKCTEYGIDYSVFLSLIQKESNFNTNAKSNSGDYGLCQINKCNHAWMREVFGNNWDPMNPYHSIDGCTYILNTIITNYNYKTYHALLMGYNMGPGGAKKCFNNGIYSSKYSRSIMDKAVEYGYTGDGVI